ncbi:hypothetical protein JGX26_000624 [Aeromonas veronii]|nr:hypothetical protein [Aeromonas veronii]
MTLKPPKATKGDAAHAIMKAGLSALPMIGGPAVELFQSVVQSPLERRRIEWMQAVGERLQELEDSQRINLEKLRQSEKFISTVMHATTIALRTHEAEKREALRNAVIHVALGQSPEDALEHMFFEWIDTFSGMHLQELSIAGIPPQQRTTFQRSIRRPFDSESQNPSGRLKREIEDIIWADLHARRLVNVGEKPNMPQINITQLGRMFLDFISN